MSKRYEIGKTDKPFIMFADGYGSYSFDNFVDKMKINVIIQTFRDFTHKYIT
ncbi:hypothetical protein GCM10007932_05230 [Vibrio penaeicida]|uniref:Uncharacterized protein n=2 Tax=Vibrio TaxID=662 RepID=A0A510IES3_9VIBR|nr:hypothetical protein VroAM7_48760 [Vibrio rotiferianus]GLQ71163.1 hypothetical protein GCM10007932_05230 [Vibrio penaeicida]